MDEQQTNQKQSLFRRKAMARLSSPEDLEEYLTVTGPGVWLPLAAVMVLLIGVIVWMIFGKIYVTETVAVQAGNGLVMCYVPEEQLTEMADTITIGGTTYALVDVGYASQPVTDAMSTAVRWAGGLELGQVVTPLRVDAQLEDGIYTGTITVQAIHPITYVIN